MDCDRASDQRQQQACAQNISQEMTKGCVVHVSSPYTKFVNGQFGLLYKILNQLESYAVIG
jgi:hypothetical protein